MVPYGRDMRQATSIAVLCLAFLLESACNSRIGVNFLAGGRKPLSVGDSVEEGQTPAGSLSITDAHVGNDATIAVAWTSSMRSATYDVVIASDAACNVPIFAVTDVTLSSKSGIQVPSGKYFVCVFAKGADGSRIPA